MTKTKIPPNSQHYYNADQPIPLTTDIGLPPQYWNKRPNRITETLASQFGFVDKPQATLIQKQRKAEASQ